MRPAEVDKMLFECFDGAGRIEEIQSSFLAWWPKQSVETQRLVVQRLADIAIGLSSAHIGFIGDALYLLQKLAGNPKNRCFVLNHLETFEDEFNDDANIRYWLTAGRVHFLSGAEYKAHYTYALGLHNLLRRIGSRNYRKTYEMLSNEAHSHKFRTCIVRNEKDYNEDRSGRYLNSWHEDSNTDLAT
jgi:hypothetical protein